MSIAQAELEAVVAELARRPGHEKVRALLYRLLTGALGASSEQIAFERALPEVRGRVDALLGRTLIEIKADLRRESPAAEAQLAQLQAQREREQREILARREAALAALPSVTAPLPRPQRSEPRAEPSAAGTAGNQRVVLHHRAGSYAASEAAGAMASQVREAGFDLNETRAVTATPSQRVVRYFHAEDAPAAARLAGRLGRVRVAGDEVLLGAPFVFNKSNIDRFNF